MKLGRALGASDFPEASFLGVVARRLFPAGFFPFSFSLSLPLGASSRFLEALDSSALVISEKW